MVADDVEAHVAWRNRPEVSTWLLHTRTDAAALRAELSRSRGEGELVLVALRGEVQVAAGYLSVRDGMGQDVGGEHRGAEVLLGWNVAPGHWGRGYGTQVARTLLDVAFGDLEVHRVTAGCFADNTASWRVMERVGMRREQHGIEDSWHAELGWVDGYTYAMLRREWAARPA
jgi:RimJ/RimL family protein N-acetyltransferase